MDYAHPLPSTSNPLYPISQDSTLTFSVRFNQVSAFLREVEELPHDTIAPDQQSRDVQSTRPWAMKAAKSGGKTSEKSIRGWGTNAWTSFVDLLKVRSLLGSA